LIVIVQRLAGHSISVTPLLNRAIVEATGFGQLAIERNGLCGAGVEPVFKILFDYNFSTHCGSRLNRDAALAKLKAVLVTLF
jgi:hypothetical protein